MTTIQLFVIPYDSGHRAVRMGAGPEHFVNKGIVQILRQHGWTVNVETIEAQRPFRTEIYTAFELCQHLAQRIQAAKDQGAFPLILSGNCNTFLGTISGLDSSDLGIIWFDAHGDFNTPETTTGGFLDGMGLAIATGHCWTKLAQTIPGFAAVPHAHVLLIGVRQLDPAEQEQLEQSGIMLVRDERIREVGLQESLKQALTELRSRVRRVYVHIDLDMLDTQVGKANSYAQPHGLLLSEGEEALSMVVQHFDIVAAGIASYDPSYDKEGTIFHAGVRLMERIGQAV